MRDNKGDLAETAGRFFILFLKAANLKYSTALKVTNTKNLIAMTG